MTRQMELVVLDEAVIQRLNNLPRHVRQSFGKTMLSLAKESRDYIRRSKLSGQVLRPSLKRKKWPLRRSIRYKLSREKESITAIIGTPIHFYQVHEYGWSGQQSVKAFLRRTKGKKFFFDRGKRAGQVNISKTRRELQAKKATVKVKAFQRHVTFPERSFMRTAMQELEPRITQEMERTLEEIAR